MEHTEQDRLWIWLGSVEGIGAQSFYTLIAAFGDAGEVYRAKEDDPRLSKLSAAVRARLKKAQTGAYMEALFGRLEKKGIKAVSRLHPDYPPPLQDIFLPPPALYVLAADCPSRWNAPWPWSAAAGRRVTAWRPRSR